jgi:hypothetical protein
LKKGEKMTEKQIDVLGNIFDPAILFTGLAVIMNPQDGIIAQAIVAGLLFLSVFVVVISNIVKKNHNSSFKSN